MRRSPHRWTDYVGFAAFVFLAVWTFVRMPTVSIFLLPTFAHELFIALAFLLRNPAKVGAPTLPSRLAAYAGTFMLIFFFHAARTWYPAALTLNAQLEARGVGVMLWLTGSVLALTGIWSLRRSFSIEPQARQLVTSGPYRYARHPIYACYLLQYSGLLLVYPTVALFLVLALWTTLMLVRMHFEERVLESAFPEYAAYKTRVGRLAPRQRPRPLPDPAAQPERIGKPFVVNHG